MIAEMKRARHLLESSGWVGPAIEPMCIDSAGRPCLEDDEGVRRFSVIGALIEARAWPEGWHFLEQVIAPAWAALRVFRSPDPPTLPAAREFHALCRAAAPSPTLEEWLATEGRKDGEVLAAFADAIARSKKARTGGRHG